ncbi:uncharacterized protein LOC143214785 [Lasioglossum baleicum]|uniref:uncharacterized protein LOC143214785 n=1 Tax=Lasioglossum baleicum TaxID=434251 RepID=UPI003FCE5F3D
MSNITYEGAQNEMQLKWLLDSGCTDHIVNEDMYFDECVTLKVPVNVKVGDGRVLQATKSGTITTFFSVYNERVKVVLPDVYFVKNMEANLISYAKVTDKNTIISKGDFTKIYNQNRKLVAMAKKENGLYKVTSDCNAEKMERKANIINKGHQRSWSTNI